MDSCVFCKIIKGALPASVVYENETTLAIMDINPINKGHVLIMPKKHYASLREMPEQETAQLMSVVAKVEKAVWEVEDIACTGTNILQNNGRHAWQDVFHVHFHVIPRFEGDGFKIKFQAGKPERAVLDQLAGSIAGQL